ncbi:MAG: MBL fold metallo-hydrolase [Candidatus Methanomethylophilaceae archaeon]|nr:MBL fold metallo-hydrolase [Candidatus Methanomethylophilaceae archaeon]
MSFKVTCVYDEGAKENTSLIGAKGSAMLVDMGGKRLLFDTGLRGRYLAHNLGCLDVDPDSIDAVVVSQAHPDNSRGLDGLLKERTKPVEVYAMEGMYAARSGLLSRPGISEASSANASLRFDEGWVEPVPNVFRTPYLDAGNGYREAYLVIDAPRGLAVLSGRGVGGPENALMEAESRFGKKVMAFLGSVDLEKRKRPVADGYAASFVAHSVSDLRLNHRTGRDGMTNLRVNLGLAAVKDFYAGFSYTDERS